MRNRTALLVSLIAIGVMLASVAAGPAGSAATTSCTATPGKVTLQKDGTGVRAGTAPVVCHGDWSAFEGVMYSPTDGSWLAGKWSYGGTRTYQGTGSMTIPAWNRGYYHCAHWKLRIIINGHTFDGPITTFCSR